ncbi:hypothetical protein [Paenibacillus illinoisensis]|uniref:hypothetical protein n=1 Tax=Paenibacillus illinoisensis TaxID=59845 RepID=UPI0035C90DF9
MNKQDEFTGSILHSETYSTPVSFQDQKVVVIGRGNSAVQIAMELSGVADTKLDRARAGGTHSTPPPGPRYSLLPILFISSRCRTSYYNPSNKKSLPALIAGRPLDFPEN